MNKYMRFLKPGVSLTSVSFLLLLSVIGMFFFTHANPFAGVFLGMRTGIPVLVMWCILLIVSGVSLFRNRKNGFLKASFPLAINLLTLMTVLVYANLEPAQYLTDKDILVNEKNFSPDENHVILNYVYDIGALGYTATFTAVVPVKDESKNLSKFRLPIAYKKAKWLSNDSIEVEVDIRPYLAKMKEFKQEVVRIGDIKILVQTKGFDTSSPLFVEHRALSPDGRKELVAYRYRDSMASGHLHISIINNGDTIPALGNIYIGNEYHDYVYSGEWRTSDKIALYTDDKYMAERYLLDHAGVEVEFVQKKYPISGVEPGWYHNPRFGSDQYLESELSRYGRPGFAVVKDKFYYADGLRTGETDILYTYHYNGKTYSAVFREKATTPGKSTQIGDILPIMFSSNKPDVHKIIR